MALIDNLQREGVNTRKLAIAYLSLAFFLIILAFVWHSLHTGKLEVTTNNTRYTIAVSVANPKKQTVDTKYVKQGHGNLKATLGVGTYSVQIQDQRNVLITKTVTITHGKTQTYRFAPTQIGGVEPVTDNNAASLAVDNNRLVYLDGTKNTVSQIDNRNSLATLYNGLSLQSAQWNSPDYGIGQDKSGKLYELSGGSASAFNLPVSGVSITHYSLTPNKQLFLLAGADVYTGSPANGFRKIYTADLSSPFLVASNDAFVLYNLANTGEDTSDPYVEIVRSNGSVIAKKKIATTQAAWSPDGKNVALINYDGTSGIYDTSLHLQSALPVKSIKQAAWLDNTTLLYSVEGQVWSYSLRDHTASSVAKTTTGNITDIAVNTDKSYVYLASSTDELDTVSRVGLKGAAVPDSIRQLGIFLPLDLDECTVGYVNFTHFSLYLRPYSTLGISDCQQAALTRLQADGVSTGGFSIQVGPIDTSAD